VTSALLAFVVLEVTLCFIPGPAVLLTTSYALRRGKRSGFAAAAGIITGNTAYFVLSGLGIVAVVLASYQVFTIVKYAGAAYLAFVGLRALFARRAPAIDATPERPGERGRAYAGGLVTQLANPKALVFFAAVLPQFVDPHASLPPQIALLAAVGALIELSVLATYTLAADRLRRSAAASRVALWFERGGGAALLWIASRIVREPLAATR
jgi:threonine/homoserine/homoserine lactone efflux protein